jgi:hypothetical protein
MLPEWSFVHQATFFIFYYSDPVKALKVLETEAISLLDDKEVQKQLDKGAELISYTSS